MAFFNVVTMTTIGYGANFYPRTPRGRSWVTFFCFVSLANMAMLIEAVTTYVAEASAKRHEARRQETIRCTGLDELETLLRRSAGENTIQSVASDREQQSV